MTKILGLDLGTNSIGWAVIDKNEKKIINAGVRIFPEGVVKETIGKGDKEVSKSADRRSHRQARRLNYRKRLRKIKLLQTLINVGMCPLNQQELNVWKNWDKQKKSAGRVFPSSTKFVDWLRMNPYALRSKAINEKISKRELGRILYHFIQRRGFLSSRKGNEDGAIYKGNENMEGIEATKDLIKNQTLGERLMRIYPPEKKPYKRVVVDGKETRIRARYTLREMYVYEFEKIWVKQATHLGLDKIKMKTKKVIQLKTPPDSQKSKRKLESYISKYGVDNVNIENRRVEVYKEVTLKEFLAGEIAVKGENITFKSNESVLFWQRQLRSQKGLLGKCTFEGKMFFDKKTSKWINIGPTPCPLSHPDYELFRAYQFISNIRLGKNNMKLSDKQRETVLALINKSDSNFDFIKIPKELKLAYETFNYEDKQKVPGNPTHKKIRPYFSDKQWEEDLNNIWHCFYFFEDPKLLKNKLIESYGLNDKKAEQASKVKLAEGYGNVSLKAIKNILPFLKIGFVYSTSVILGGVKNAFGTRWSHFEMYHDEIISKVVYLVERGGYKEYELIEKLKELLASPENNYGFEPNDRAFRRLYHHSQATEKKKTKKRISEIENLRNPIVQKGLNEMRRLVNNLLEEFSNNPEYGPDFAFDKIHVELGRNLRNNKKRRQEISLKISENEKANEEARLRLAEFGLKPSRENITKFRLFAEIQGKNGTVVCPYTNNTISITDLLGRANLYQIEHIIPFSVSLDDSFANKTICESNFNREKGELTPYEFYQKNSDPKLWGAYSWEELEQRTFSLLPYPKAKKFCLKKRLDKGEFIERQLNDMRFISKRAAEILSEISDNVRVMPGQLTSELRRLWGLNNIVQPVFPLHLKGYMVDENQSLPHYLMLDELGKPKEIMPIQAQRPITSEGEILIPGYVNEKKQFVADKSYRHLNVDLITPKVSSGKYWAKLKVDKPISFTRIFSPRPSSDADSIVYRGKVEKGVFMNDSIAKRIRTACPDGAYWLKLAVKNRSLIKPGKDALPTAGRNQVLLYGNVKDGVFSSYIYECAADEIPGNYWVILDVDFETPEFSKAIINPDKQSLDELIITGAVGDDATFVADCDPNYKIRTKLPASKYFVRAKVLEAMGCFPIVNHPPDIEPPEMLLEGSVWVNRQSGEIMFDPKKNRDDQRHHAIDAVTIALTELGYLQKMSHYFGAIKERERGIGTRPVFDLPWEGFDKDVKQVIDNILVSYSRKTKVLSRISKTILKSGVKYKSVGYSARGRLHREYYFGKHPNPVPGVSGTNHGGVLFEKDNRGNLVQYYHIRKPISNIKNNKHVEKIVDLGIRKLIEERLTNEFGINVKGAYTIPPNFFYNNEKLPMLFLKNKNGDPVPIKKVRIRESIGNAAQLKDKINQWVNPYNNHHVVIYVDYNDELKEQVVSFWDVVERINQGEQVYKLPENGVKIITTLQENEMFLLNLLPEQLASINQRILPMNVMSQHLFRVQKISSMYYTFRHHLASTVLNEDEEERIVSMSAWQRINPIKVEVDTIGNIRIK